MKLVLNIDRVGRQALAAQRRHDQRTGGDLTHTDPKRRHWNKVLVGSGDCVADVDAVLAAKQAKIRRDNEAPFTRFVLSASPEYFRGDDGRLNPERVREFALSARKWLRKEYGEGLAYAVLHLDERTPHIHAVAVPLYRKKTKRGEAWAVSHHEHEATKGFGSYEHLRRRAADALGLEYGEPGNKPRTEQERLLAEREAAVAVQEKAVARAAAIVEAARRQAGRPPDPDLAALSARRRRRPDEQQGG